MVTKLSKWEMDSLYADDDGNVPNLTIHRSETRHPTIQSLLQEWIPPQCEGGYTRFIEDYRLQGIVSEEQLETLFMHPEARMGKNLAGILSTIVPPDLCSWRQMKNMYQRVGNKQKLEGKAPIEIEIPKEETDKYLFNVTQSLLRTNEAGFEHILRLYRRVRLLTQYDMAHTMNVTQSAVAYWENGVKPENRILHKLYGSLDMAPAIELLIAHSPKKNLWLHPRADKPDLRQHDKYLAALEKGGIFGLLLSNIRQEKGLTQKQLAEMIGCNEATIFRWENGKFQPDIQNVDKLCASLNIDPNTRLRLLDYAGKGALRKIQGDDSELRRRGLIAITGGGNMFGAILRKLRVEKGWDQATLANKAGISRQTITECESGANPPPTNMIIYKICDALELEDTSLTKTLLLKSAENYHNIRNKGQEIG